MGSEVETAGVGVLAPIGTMPISSGRREGEAGERVESEESDCAVIWANAGAAVNRANNKRAPQDGGLFWERGGSDFRIYKPSRPLRCSYKRRLPALSRIPNLMCRPGIMGSVYKGS